MTSLEAEILDGGFKHCLSILHEKVKECIKLFAIFKKAC